MTDEAHFKRCITVNCQNYKITGAAVTINRMNFPTKINAEK